MLPFLFFTTLLSFFSTRPPPRSTLFPYTTLFRSLSHIEHQRLSAVTDHRSLQHELNSLGDGHEEPGDVRVGHRHWAAPFDLSDEGVQNRPSSGQHVAETHAQDRKSVV